MTCLTRLTAYLTESRTLVGVVSSCLDEQDSCYYNYYQWLMQMHPGLGNDKANMKEGK